MDTYLITRLKKQALLLETYVSEMYFAISKVVPLFSRVPSRGSDEGWGEASTSQPLASPKSTFSDQKWPFSDWQQGPPCSDWRHGAPCSDWHDGASVRERSGKWQRRETTLRNGPRALSSTLIYIKGTASQEMRFNCFWIYEFNIHSLINRWTF